MSSVAWPSRIKAFRFCVGLKSNRTEMRAEFLLPCRPFVSYIRPVARAVLSVPCYLKGWTCMPTGCTGRFIYAHLRPPFRHNRRCYTCPPGSACFRLARQRCLTLPPTRKLRGDRSHHPSRRPALISLSLVCPRFLFPAAIHHFVDPRWLSILGRLDRAFELFDTL